MKFKDLTLKERFYIEKGLKKGMSITELSKDLNRAYNTIKSEIKRGTVMQRRSDLSEYEIYLADAGQRVHDLNSIKKGVQKKLLPDNHFFDLMYEYIVKQKYSPQAFLHSLSPEQRLIGVTTIYNYIESGYLENISWHNLPYFKPKKNKSHKPAKSYPKGDSIEDRPEYIKDRDNCQYGHWELDTVYSSKDDKSCLMVLTERKFREEIIMKCKDRTSASIIKAFNKLEKYIGTNNFRKKFKTITCDNGVEFSGWELIEKCRRSNQKRTKIYFCHPYSSYERGSNENLNRMIRRWIPKGDDIGLYSDEEIRRIQEWINNYPRKIFGWKSSREMMEDLLSIA